MKVNKSDPIIVSRPRKKNSIGPRLAFNPFGNVRPQESSAGKNPMDKLFAKKPEPDPVVVDSTTPESETREEKVAAIKKAVEAGEYNPPLDKVAEKMIVSSLLDTLQKKKK